MSTISFHVTREEHALISKIVDRAFKASLIDTGDVADLNMDLTACHANGTPLKLDELLKAPAFDFAHDIRGITRHISRTTGKIGDCFLPRYAQPEKVSTNG